MQQQPIKHHWVMTVQADARDGRQGTFDGSIDVTPGVNTHTSSYQAVFQHVKQQMGVDNLCVLFFALHPDQF
ncbi:hypothetical protein [Streptomyces sp. WMMC897]|uniref:hypothetical protein n=1 Tax=Streptomyces sp. WMMC897 TaxID=3014782 RepID=UPI0022B66B21|nr:hypothetical protein [Streptomyces sp. WMMC897]MCZ7413055.1 hypothetical protein [Streptomyces sp. WMMC897]MCZ7413143.1 hypothetical protein [Streptomyces sp. WMMC897]MCZ7415473.1 hypothetical protein [Streptomyces sp. WMMC897]